VGIRKIDKEERKERFFSMGRIFNALAHIIFIYTIVPVWREGMEWLKRPLRW
jgi:hypothetical protein